MLSEIGSNFWITPSDLQGTNNCVMPEMFGCSGNDSCWLSTGRSAISFVLKAIEHRKGEEQKVALIPAFTCDTVARPFLSAGYELYTYPVDENLCVDAETILALQKDIQASVVLVHRYYGFDTITNIDILADTLRTRGVSLIEDKTQCLYSQLPEIDADYIVGSIRKWNGVPDGGFAICREGYFCDKPVDQDIVLQESKKTAAIEKYKYLFQGQGEKETFLDMFRNAEDHLDNQKKIYTISDLSLQIQSNQNIDDLRHRRQRNYMLLSDGLQSVPGVRVVFEHLPESVTPLYCPVYVDDRLTLQRHLVSESIYAPVVWPQTDVVPSPYAQVNKLYHHLLCIPIDQRYSKEDMLRVVEAIRHLHFSPFTE